MGLKFSKEMTLTKELIVPQNEKKQELTPIQERLLKKFAPNAFPFTYYFPVSKNLTKFGLNRSQIEKKLRKAEQKIYSHGR